MPVAPRGPAPWTDRDLALLESVYELQCTSRMSALYYERRLGHLQKQSFWMEIVTAATASGSGLAALTSWQHEPWRSAWQALALLAAAVAVIRPIYAPGKKIEAFTRQQQGYHANYFALRKLAFSIRQEGCVGGEHRRRWDTIFDRHVQLSNEDENAPHLRCLKEARDRVAAELPWNSFWRPPVSPDPPAPRAPAPEPASCLPAPFPSAAAGGDAAHAAPSLEAPEPWGTTPPRASAG